MTTAARRNTGIKRLIVIQGPTGIGKTAVGIALARHYGIPILSADSRQVYREMSIGTAVPTAEELSAAQHYFIRNKTIHESFTAGDYEREALELLENELFPKHDNILVVGGSGLYVDALLKGFDRLPDSDETLREQLSETPPEELLEELRQADPTYYEQVDRSNPQRVIRAVEVCRLTGRPYSELRSGAVKERPFEVLKIGLNLDDRETLYDRITRRVDRMIEEDLTKEARGLYPYKNLNALQTVGYRELFDHFDGLCSLEEAVERIKQNSRRYAKRQLTWLRRDDEVRWFAPNDINGMIAWIDGID